MSFSTKYVIETFNEIYNTENIQTLIDYHDNFDYIVRRAVAGNKNTPPEILTILSEDKEESVREFVADNPSTPKDVLHELATDEEWCVRWALALAEHTPINTLYVLSCDDDADVRRRALERI